MSEIKDLIAWIREFKESKKIKFADYFSNLNEKNQQHFIKYLKIAGYKFSYSEFIKRIKYIEGKYHFLNENDKKILFEDIDAKANDKNFLENLSFGSLIRNANFEKIIKNWNSFSLSQKRFAAMSYEVVNFNNPSGQGCNSFLHLAIQKMEYEDFKYLLLDTFKSAPKDYFREYIRIKNEEGENLLDIANKMNNRDKIHLIANLYKKTIKVNLSRVAAANKTYDISSVNKSIIRLAFAFDQKYNLGCIETIKIDQDSVIISKEDKFSEIIEQRLNKFLSYLDCLYKYNDEQLFSFISKALSKEQLEKLNNIEKYNNFNLALKAKIANSVAAINDLIYNNKFLSLNALERLPNGLYIKNIIGLLIDKIVNYDNINNIPEKLLLLQFELISTIHEFSDKKNNYTTKELISNFLSLFNDYEDLVEVKIIKLDDLISDIKAAASKEIEKISHKLKNKDIFIWCNKKIMPNNLKNELAKDIKDQVISNISAKYSKYYSQSVINKIFEDFLGYSKPGKKVEEISLTIDISSFNIEELMTIIKGRTFPHFLKLKNGSYYPSFQYLYDKDKAKFMQVTDLLCKENKGSTIFDNDERLIFLLSKSASNYFIEKCADKYNRIAFTKNSMLDEIFLAACQLGLKEEIINLINKGANVNANDKYGISVLHWCVRNKLDEIILLLAKKEVDPNPSALYGTTPIMIAAKQNNYMLCEILMAIGADPLINNTRGSSALTIAAYNKASGITRLFLKKKVISRFSSHFRQRDSMLNGIFTYILINRALNEAN